MARILIMFASSYGQTRLIAETIASQLRHRGHQVELADAFGHRPPAPGSYDAVMLGSRVHLGRHASEVLEYMVEHRGALAERPTAMFSVSMAAAGTAEADPNGYLATLFGAVGWWPSLSIAFGGALPYRRYGAVTRFVMKHISRRHGHSTDTSRNHEFTDWDAVVAFADRFDAEIEAAAAATGPDDPTRTASSPLRSSHLS